MINSVGQQRTELPAIPPWIVSEHSHLHALAYAYLKDLLLNGGLDPGDRISTDIIGRAIGCSRAPVTDAVKHLTADGFLVVLPQVGIRVTVPIADEVTDFYDLFAMSEGLIARFATSRRSREEARELEHLVENFKHEDFSLYKSAAPGAALREQNRRRHYAIHELARSPLTAQIASSLWDRCDFFIRVAFGRFCLSSEAQIAQSKIIVAICEGDSHAAEQTTREYILELGSTVAKSIGC
jgi:DNA-binding GntR family transcriptional regulator